jgi:hypothetical protein
MAMRTSSAANTQHQADSAQQRRRHQQQLISGRSTVDNPFYEMDKQNFRRGGKYLYARQDTTTLAEIDAYSARLRHGCSPQALAVSSRADGLVSTVEEFHGFVYQTPLVVRISTLPVLEEPENTPSAANACQKPNRSSRVKEQWSSFVIRSKGNFVGVAGLPLARLLRISQACLFDDADSGDILLEGSYHKARALYAQDMAGSLSSHVSVVYREPITRALYLLTSRQWSKRFHRGSDKSLYHELACLDYKTLKCSDGVTMHPLEAWVAHARQQGGYFLLRTLAKGKRAPTALQRQRIGQRLFEWFLANQGIRPAPISEQRLRLKVASKFDSMLAELLGFDGLQTGQEKLVSVHKMAQVSQALALQQREKYATILNRSVESKCMTSSEVVLAALEHAQIFDLGAAADPETAKTRRIMSSSNMFELRRLPLCASRHADGLGGWGYEMLTLITGDKQHLGARGYMTSVSHHGRVEMSAHGQPLNWEEGAV